jgi:hypothetical protein
MHIYIYRKPTSTDKTIHFESSRSTEHKLAAYSFFLKTDCTNFLYCHENNKESSVTQCILLKTMTSLEYNIKNKRIQQKLQNLKAGNLEHRSHKEIGHF